MATYYFAYGADMDAAERDLHHDRRRRPRVQFAKSTPAVLQGYRLICDIASQNRHSGIFNVTPDPSSAVHGMIFELHPGDTISVASLKEGEKADYSLSVLPVKTRKGETIPALVLHAREGPLPLQPSTEYLNIVIRTARDHGLPVEWIQYLETLHAAPATPPSPKSARRRNSSHRDDRAIDGKPTD